MKRINGGLIEQSLWKRTRVVITGIMPVIHTFVYVPQLWLDYKSRIIETQLMKCMNVEKRYEKFW